MKRMCRALSAAALICTTTGFALAGESQTAFRGVIVLDGGNVNGALSLSGVARMYAPAVYVNSTSRSGATISGSAVLETPELKVSGGANLAKDSSFTGPVVVFPGPALDPCGGLAVSVAAGADDLGAMNFSGGTRMVSPGYYSGGLAFNGGARVTFSPGVYFIDGGINITSAEVTGDNVTLVVLSGAINLSGNAVVHLTASEDGDYAGVVIAQPPSNSQPFTLSGGAEVQVTGIVWAPAAAMSVSGTGEAESQGPAIGDMLLVKRLAVTGTGTVRIGGDSQEPVPPPQLQGLHD
jgi:hypothetical protein